MNKRPIIILLLAIILILIGNLYVFFAGRFLSSSLEPSIYIAVIGIFYISTGFGLLLRKKWGWWLGIFFSIYGVLGFFDNFTLINTFDYVTGRPILTSSDIVKSFIISTLFLGLTMYFFKRSILSYYDMERISKRNFIILISLAIIIKVGYYLI